MQKIKFRGHAIPVVELLECSLSDLPDIVKVIPELDQAGAVKYLEAMILKAAYVCEYIDWARTGSPHTACVKHAHRLRKDMRITLELLAEGK